MSFAIKRSHSYEARSPPKKAKSNCEPLKESRLTNLQSIDHDKATLDHIVPSSATPSPLSSSAEKKGKNVMGEQEDAVLADQDPDVTLLDLETKSADTMDMDPKDSLDSDLFDLRYKPATCLTRLEQLEQRIREFQKLLNDLIQNGAETRIKLSNALSEREAALKERDLALVRVAFLKSQLNAVHALSAIDKN
ncbi:hypothetical protein D9758_006953 [Tetrapyrgos nigripes]|uniref:Uncharacterized protein n=1 Tax=Tetrapyrgos nigripes TaxID=182062 RepID=A0A8H5GSN0_9AGAR|nr:hypothetical protein D9758_006953 [Tetrapyrgos nigripes]